MPTWRPRQQLRHRHPFPRRPRTPGGV